MITVDTLAIARNAFYFPSNALRKVANYLGLGTIQRHRALDDARLTKRVFEILTKDLQAYHYVPLPPGIEEVLNSGGLLRIRYVSARGEETIRIIKPQRVSTYRDYIYLEAHCYLRDALRVFRLDRVLEMENVEGFPKTND